MHIPNGLTFIEGLGRCRECVVVQSVHSKLFVWSEREWMWNKNDLILSINALWDGNSYAWRVTLMIIDKESASTPVL